MLFLLTGMFYYLNFVIAHTRGSVNFINVSNAISINRKCVPGALSAPDTRLANIMRVTREYKAGEGVLSYSRLTN